MIYRFNSNFFFNRNRAFVKMPFNLWEKTGLKGNIPCKVTINKYLFECKLITKGNGFYLIPITKKILSNFNMEEDYEIEIELVDKLSRINHESPYTKEHPIRKIDAIEELEIMPGFCGHSFIAMLAGVFLNEVLILMGRKKASWSTILEALDYYGISYASKAVYPKGKSVQLPKCCIVYNDKSFILWYKDSFIGVKNVDQTKRVSYLEIFVE